MLYNYYYYQFSLISEKFLEIPHLFICGVLSPTLKIKRPRWGRNTNLKITEITEYYRKYDSFRKFNLLDFKTVKVI